MSYVETKYDLEWELWMMDMCGDVPQAREYRKKRRAEIKRRLAEIELAKLQKSTLN